jgi:hypothetical protein
MVRLGRVELVAQPATFFARWPILFFGTERGEEVVKGDDKAHEGFAGDRHGVVMMVAANTTPKRKGMSRREFLTSLAAFGIGAAGGLGTRGEAILAHGPDGMDAVTHYAYDALKGWIDWLKDNGVRGYLGETSTPNTMEGHTAEDVQKWNGLLEKVYSWCDSYGLWATAWVAARSGGANHLRMYGPTDISGSLGQRTIGVAHEQASIIEAHPSIGPYMTRRGVNVNGGELGVADTFSNENPGTFGQTYYYPDLADFLYLAGRGHLLARIPFRWERLQPTIKGELSQTELSRLKSCVADCNATGMQAILDVHNYASYFRSDGYHKIGTEQLPVSVFADLWRRLSLALMENPNIFGYDIMNEPKEMPGGAAQWEQASQAAVNAIRGNGDVTRIFVPGYHKHPSVSKGGVFAFALNHPVAWIRDPLDKTFYTTHAYWGRYSYRYTYDEDNAHRASQGY